MGAVFSGFGTSKASKETANAARDAGALTAAATDRATQENSRQSALARRDFLNAQNGAENALLGGFQGAQNALAPLLQGEGAIRDAILYENGLGEAPEGYEGIQSTPGFDFLESEGRRAILNRASAMGGLNSGAVLKELSRYQTGLDSQNYQAGYNRLLGLDDRARSARGALVDLNNSLGANRANVFMGHGTNLANTRLNEGQVASQNALIAGNAASEAAIRVGNARAQGTQALFDIPLNQHMLDLQTASTGAEAFGNIAGGMSSFAAISDSRDKSDVEDIGVGLDFLMDLEPVTFTYDVRHGENPMDGTVSGFMAQSLQKVQEDHGVDLGLVNDSDEQHLTVNYASLIPVLVGAVQELTQKVNELEGA